MKIIQYILLVIFTLAYAVNLAIDAGFFLFGGLGGPYPHFWVLPAAFILATVCFVLYIKGLRASSGYSVSKIIVLAILLIISLPVPIIYAYQLQKKSDDAHSEYQKTCRLVELRGFQYNFCPGRPGTFGPGVSVIGSNPGDQKFNEAMKVWDTEGWKKFKSETDWYYEKNR